ncbi:PREDICTED: UPF0472 protein C16orf72 [Condylura cristata]|uniref:UPF0472 protein C16orf72 n=1 Tax=Condylura cristata TaxID=143302 RepID=UPI000643B2D4|nr:PREDICTED: UPF0472 protein C16orf72 [Condylura cristata]
MAVPVGLAELRHPDGGDRMQMCLWNTAGQRRAPTPDTEIREGGSQREFPNAISQTLYPGIGMRTRSGTLECDLVCKLGSAFRGGVISPFADILDEEIQWSYPSHPLIEGPTSQYSILQYEVGFVLEDFAELQADVRALSMFKQVAEPWFSKWERQCLAEAEQEAQLPPELQEEAAGPQSERQRLWHLFQISATAVAQLYKDGGCPQPGRSVWDPFQHAAMAVTSLYKESGDAHQRSFDLGVQVGCQRRIKDVLEWVKKGRSTILREDLISFLCGKVPPAPPPPSRPSRVPPKPPAGAPGQPAAPESSSSVDVDLQPFHEAIALHGLSGAMASISVRSGAPGSPPPVSGAVGGGRRKSSCLEDDLNPFDSEELGQRLDSGGTRKRPSAQCGDGISDSPTYKRNRLV